MYIFFLMFLKGNNIFGDDIPRLLSKNDGSRTQYILMDKILPPVMKNYIVQVHKKEIEEEDVICEFGVFGVVIRYVIFFFLETGCIAFVLWTEVIEGVDTI